jgi:hypothetical protein
MRAAAVGSFAARRDTGRVQRTRKEGHRSRKEGIKARAPAAERVHGVFMTDLLMLAIFTAFFALAVLFVKGCERIVGAETELVPEEEPAADDRAAA